VGARAMLAGCQHVIISLMHLQILLACIMALRKRTWSPCWVVVMTMFFCVNAEPVLLPPVVS